MSILSRIVSTIETVIYPHVKSDVDAVVGTAEAVAEHVEEAVEVAAQKVVDANEEIAEVILASPPSRHRLRETLAAQCAAHKAETGEDLSDYPNSIVDLLKLVHEPSSMAARKALAVEFGIPDYHGTAEQNRQLAAEVMKRFD